MTDKFYVGQLVRFIDRNILGFHREPTFDGAIGRITGPGPMTNGYLRWRLDIPGPNGKVASCIEPCLEPIYDGDTLVAWSDCAWRPKELVKA